MSAVDGAMTGGPLLEQQVKAFVAEFIGVDRHQLHLGSTIFGDLRVDGDDAANLIEEFARRFSVDLTGYDHRRYFGTEEFNPAGTLWVALRQLVGLSPEKAAGLDPVTIQSLVESARGGRWIN
jgi:hypothetical protein